MAISNYVKGHFITVVNSNVQNRHYPRLNSFPVHSCDLHASNHSLTQGAYPVQFEVGGTEVMEHIHYMCKLLATPLLAPNLHN